MNNKDTSIGIDPNNMPVIESLDDEPVNNKKNKNKSDVLKKIIFTIVVIILMFAVAGGLYYYLHLGQENKKNANFTIDIIESVQGLELSKDVNDYGDFSKVDVTKCKIDLSKVDINTPNTYDYSVSCSKNVKENKIVIKKFNNLVKGTKLVYKKTRSSLNAKEFIINPDTSYVYRPQAGIEFKNYLSSEGIYSVDLYVGNNNDIEQRVFGVLVVSSEQISKILDCQKDNISDRFLLNVNDYRLSNAMRIYSYKYNDDSLLSKDIKSIENGMLEKDGISGKIVYDKEAKELSLITVLSNETLNKEYSSIFFQKGEEISKYYTEKGYICNYTNL